jgi:hypothetical protein
MNLEEVSKRNACKERKEKACGRGVEIGKK